LAMEKAPNWRSRVRLQALRALLLGYSRAQVCELCARTDRMVRLWIDLFNSGGANALVTKAPSGRKRKLSGEQIEILRALLTRGAVANGWHNELWTIDRVAVVIRRHFKVKVSCSLAWQVLKRYLGWTSKRPVQRLAERDEPRIARWKADGFPRILSEVEQKNAHLVFIDEAGFLLSPNVRRTFSPRGQAPVIKVGDPHARISVIGALSISPKRKRLYFLHYLLHDNANFRSDSVVSFVKALRRHFSGPIIILCDAFKIHCSKLMLAYLKSTPPVQIEEFPPCAPELNPVDKAWAYLKHGRLANYTPRNLAEMRKRLEFEFRNLRGKQNVLLWCVRESGLGSALDRFDRKHHPID